MIELTPKVIKDVELLFSADEQELVKNLLREKCGETVPGTDPHAPPYECDIIRCAVLELSEGQLDQLRELVDLANTDWRDVLSALYYKRKSEGKI